MTTLHPEINRSDLPPCQCIHHIYLREQEAQERAKEYGRQIEKERRNDHS